MKRTILVVVCILAACSGAWAQRLPDTVVPGHYDLTFTPDLAKATFTGDETIQVQVRQATPSITLNSAEIEFQEVHVTSGGSTQAATVTKDDKAEMATLAVPRAIPSGPATIHIKFTGVLNDKLRGFYLSQTKRRRYAVTQMEATDARRAFPSFDEPAMKATFDITLIIDKGDTAISNGTIVSDTPGPGEGKHTVKFSTSPKMSSYLVAMMVGDFECLKGEADGIPIRVCAVPEKKDLGAYALTVSEHVLHFYDQYFSVKYPYKKLDHIAFPDFSAGAMENTATITYRESALLIDDKNASVDSREGVAYTIAHEMAHQWFGDLVTMKWWDNIWLNEGFATWMSNKPVEAWKPEWHAEMDEIHGTEGALGNDSIASIRSIRARAETPAEIVMLFDEVAYGKAASVLRSLEAYLGPEVFRKGVNNYLEQHSYGNATAEDFWGAIAAASHQPIDQIMPTFVTQPGAPLVSVKTSCSSSGKTEVALSQTRFFADRTRLAGGSAELWQIPTCIKKPGSAVTCEVMTQKTQTFELPGCSPWVFLNAGGKGYYRTGYDSDAVAKISANIETALTPEERMRFLGDAWSLVTVGREPIGDYLNIIGGLKNERTRAVVESMINPLFNVHDRLVADADKGAFEAWVRQLLKPMAQDLGATPKPSDTDEIRSLRGTVLVALGFLAKDPAVIAQARAITEQYMKDPASVDAQIADNAVAIAAQNGDAALYDQFMEHLKTAKTPEEYQRYLGNLGSFPDLALAKRTMEFVLSPDVKGQDLFAVGGVLFNPATQQFGWEYFKAHFKQIQEKAGPELGGGLVQVANVFCDAKLRDDSQKFFHDLNLPGSERELRNAEERVNACIELRSLQQANLSQFLKQQTALSAGGGAAASTKH